MGLNMNKVTKSRLKELYEVKKFTISHVCFALGITRKTLFDLFEEYGIKSRGRGNLYRNYPIKKDNNKMQ